MSTAFCRPRTLCRPVARPNTVTRHYRGVPPIGRISSRGASGSKLGSVVIFFEVLLALAAVAIIAFSLYVVFRLVTDES